MGFLYEILIAYFLDILYGDPKYPFHPVRLIGAAVSALENTTRKILRNEKAGGFITVLIAVLSVIAVIYLISAVLIKFNYYLYFAFNIFLIYSSFSVKNLKDESMRVYKSLKEDDLVTARKDLSFIVGRDTENLDKREISRAAVETVGENISDGFTAPLFYSILGGGLLAMVYKTINTMDSMLGYKNERYLKFGFFAAKLDDIANWVPARITGILIAICAFLLRFDFKNSLRIILRDSGKHPSPNSGFPESAVAGALGIQLGGTNYYKGVASKRPFIGDKTREIGIEDIRIANRVLYAVSAFAVVIYALLVIALRMYDTV